MDRMELDHFELGSRAAMDLLAENRLDRRSLGRWTSHLSRLIDIARERAWIVSFTDRLLDGDVPVLSFARGSM